MLAKASLYLERLLGKMLWLLLTWVLVSVARWFFTHP